MNEKAISEKLIALGKELFQAEKKPVVFTRHAEADALLNDIARYPHAFVLGCLMDRQMKGEKAWLIPYEISMRLSGFSIETLQKVSRTEMIRLMSKPKPLHRFARLMGGVFHSAVQHIRVKYAGDASRIWTGKPTSAEVVRRFLEFEGAGPKIAGMATNTLARDFKVPFLNYSAVDISADVHIRRVFGRLGLCPNDASVEQVIHKARALHPDFPGMMDLPCWEIGRNWCKPGDPHCSFCHMNKLCPSSTTRTSRPRQSKSLLPKAVMQV